VLTGGVDERAHDLGEVSLRLAQDVSHLENLARVLDVLRRGAVVDELASVAWARLLEGAEQPDERVPRTADLVAHPAEVEVLYARRLGDPLRLIVGHQAQLRLAEGQRRLDIEPALEAADVAEDAPALLGRVDVAVEARVDDVTALVLTASLGSRDLRCRHPIRLGGGSRLAWRAQRPEPVRPCAGRQPGDVGQREAGLPGRQVFAARHREHAPREHGDNFAGSLQHRGCVGPVPRSEERVHGGRPAGPADEVRHHQNAPAVQQGLDTGVEAVVGSHDHGTSREHRRLLLGHRVFAGGQQEYVHRCA
jgi:hypothetical protein